MYRIAHKYDFFKGLYKSDHATYYLQPSNSDGIAHPLPYSDVLLSDYYDKHEGSQEHYFGFGSERQMMRWVTQRDLAALEVEGYVVWKLTPLDDALEGVDYEVGETQMMFDCSRFMWEKVQ